MDEKLKEVLSRSIQVMVEMCKILRAGYQGSHLNGPLQELTRLAELLDDKAAPAVPKKGRPRKDKTDDSGEIR